MLYWALVSTVRPSDGADVLGTAVILTEGALLPLLTLHCKAGFVDHGPQCTDVHVAYFPELGCIGQTIYAKTAGQ